MAFQFIQLSNNSIGAVATGALIPLGNPTASTPGIRSCDRAFVVTTSGSDTVTAFLPGYYDNRYTGSLVAAAAGLVTLTLLVNGVEVTSVSETATAVGDTVDISLDRILRAINFYGAPTGVPISVQIRNDGVALTDGVSNFIVKKIL